MSGGQPKITVAGQTPAAESGGWYNVKPGSTVTGRYSLTGGSIRYYSCQLNTMLRAEDGVFTLKLPNLFSMTTHDIRRCRSAMCRSVRYPSPQTARARAMQRPTLPNANFHDTRRRQT